MGVVLASWIGGSAETPGNPRHAPLDYKHYLNLYRAWRRDEQDILNTAELMRMGARYYEPIIKVRSKSGRTSRPKTRSK